MRSSLLLAFLCVLLTPAAWPQENLVRNPSFEAGAGAPDDWTLTAPPGNWEAFARTGQRCVSVTPTEPGNSSWGQSDIPVKPFSTYRFSFHARVAPGTTGGCIVSGPDFANRDVNVTEDWTRRSHVFITGRDRTSMHVRLGHWEKQGAVHFDDVSVTPVLPVYRRAGDLLLGSGEEISDGAYAFTAPLSSEGANHSRPLHDFTAGFNSMRWVFGPGGQVTYHHGIPGAMQTSAAVKIGIGWYQSGDCVVEMSTDGEQFTRAGQLSALDTMDFPVPESLLPAREIYVRLRSPGALEQREDSNPGAFQVYSYAYTAQLDGDVPDLTGQTRYLDVAASDPTLAVQVEDLGAMLPGANTARVLLKNAGDARLALTARAQTVEGERGSAQASLDPGQQARIAIPYNVLGAGDQALSLEVEAPGRTLFAATAEFTVPSLYESRYGSTLEDTGDCALWWCEGTYKVARERPPITAEQRVAPVRISAARNEFEPFQLVLWPKRDLKGLTASISDLAGPGGALIPADSASICQVWYHFVDHPTDREGCVGWWPDALPPLDEPLDIKAGENQPLWVTVKVPPDAAAGDYSASLSLKADDWSATVPVSLRVWDFALPAESSVTSAFGLSAGSIWQYQNITDEADRETVWDLYMQNFRDHRISPYSFWRKGIDVEFTGLTWGGGEVVPDRPFAGDACLKVVDDSESSSIAAGTAKRMSVDPNAPYTLSFAARTAEADQQYLVTLMSYDEAGNWISGHNLDMAFTGSTEWTVETRKVVPADHSPNARSLLLVLRPALWSEEGTHTGTAWFDEVSFVKNGSEENLVVEGSFEGAQQTMHAKVDFTQWDRYAKKYLDDYKFNGFRLPLAGMGGGTFHSRSLGRIGPYKQGTPEYRRVFGEYCGQIQDHLEQNGWLDEAYIYWFDEPEPRDYDFVRDGMAEIKRAGPKLQRMLTEEPVEPLFESVDIWCPVLHNYDEEACRARQDAGSSIWWYVCTGPKAPYPGLFIDHNATELRVWLWMTWKWDVEGILVWQSNYWSSYCAYPEEPQNPYEDPMGYVSGYGRPAGFIGYWGNGDGRFIYPANKDVNADRSKHIAGPVDSIRWEMLREGLEDYEYFKLLSDLIADRAECPERALLEVPQDIVRTKSDFAKDPRAMHQHREKLARAIERLKKQ